MIPRASARRLETTLVSYSRQSLPRPARFYSTPTKQANAAFVQASLPTAEYASYMPPPPPPIKEVASNDDLQRFLKRRHQFTMLPTPLPDDKSSALNDFYFPDSPTQEQVAIMDACLHNLYDVPRAQQLFENMRRDKPGDPLLDKRVYNTFLEAYVEMATTKAKDNGEYWVRNAWRLFQIMERGNEKVVPNASTYAIILTAWMRYVDWQKKLYLPPRPKHPSQIPRKSANLRRERAAIHSERIIIPNHRPWYIHHIRY